MSFGQELRSLRKGSRLSQARLAEILSIPQATISDIEKGKYEPKINIAKRLADFFSKKIDDML